MTPTLHIDLAALARNYRLLRTRFTGAECGAVVKADAYGLGAAYVAAMLYHEGCRRFFVANVEEGAALRAILPDAEILIFHGAGPGEERDCAAQGLIPVINDLAQLERWVRAAQGAPVALHIDTGMTRLGLGEKEVEALGEDHTLFNRFNITLLMSHLACASTPKDEKNEEQLARFKRLLKKLPKRPVSLANSAGIFLDDAFHFDIARPGCALYGINPNTKAKNPVEHVATLTAPILQLRTLEQEETIGYGATVALGAGSRLATVALGYADGYLRILSNKAYAYVGDYKVPVIGRVSMDMVVVDVTGVPRNKITPATRVTFIGPQHDVNRVAGAAATIGYELFSRLGPRVKRVYTEDGQELAA